VSFASANASFGRQRQPVRRGILTRPSWHAPTRLHRRQTTQKRSLIPVAGCSLGCIMRLPTCAGTRRGPRQACLRCLVAVILPKGCTMLLLVVVISESDCRNHGQLQATPSRPNDGFIKPTIASRGC
jgi:hypothetical protein